LSGTLSALKMQGYSRFTDTKRLLKVKAVAYRYILKDCLICSRSLFYQQELPQNENLL